MPRTKNFIGSSSLFVAAAAALLFGACAGQQDGAGGAANDPGANSTAGTGGQAPSAGSTAVTNGSAGAPVGPTAGSGGASGATTTTTTPTTTTPTPTTTTTAATSVRFAVVGDYGADNADEAAVAKLVAGWNPDFVITTGDNNYPGGAASTIDANIGKYFQSYIGNYKGQYGAGSPTNRFWPSAGNHDWVSGLVPYTDYFTLPGNERYYDVDLGLVHLFAVDSDPHEPDGVTAGSTQGQWLHDRLAASKSCFNVVYFHHPAYNSGHYGPDTDMQWPFKAWGADVVMSGHEHHYERLDVGGLPYFISGGGGAGLYDIGGGVPESKVRFGGEHGAMLVTVTTTSITYEFWTASGQKVDSLTVPKTCGG
jgi:hypothetical protein